MALLDIDLAYDRVGAYDHAVKMAHLAYPDEDSVECQIALLGIELEHNKITQNEHDKGCATLRKEFWIGIVDHGFDPAQGLNGVFFEFDWNDYWIEYLKLNGYVGHDEEQIVEEWFSDVCRAQMLAEATSESPVTIY